MLGDLDLSVAAFLSRLLPAGTAIQFGAPDASWAAAPSRGPRLDAFLYDVREAQPPASDGVLTRDENGHAVGWQPPVRRYRVSYLITAWAGGGPVASVPTDPALGEHELLGSVLAGCATVAAIPPDCLHGTLAEAGEPVPLVCAGTDRAADAAQLWPRLGVPARTALDLRVVAPVVPPLLTELAPAVRGLEVGVQRKPPSAQAEARPARAEGWERRHITEG